MNNPSFVCPKCGHKIFKTTKPGSKAMLNDLTCASCGTRFTEDEVRRQAKEFADKLIRDAVRKIGK